MSPNHFSNALHMASMLDDSRLRSAAKSGNVTPPAPAGVPPLVSPGSLEDLSIQRIVQTLLAPRFSIVFDEDSPSFMPIDKSVILDKAQDKVNTELEQAKAAVEEASDKLRLVEEQASKEQRRRRRRRRAWRRRRRQAKAAVEEASDKLRLVEEQASKDVKAYELALERMRPVGMDAGVACATQDITDSEKKALCEDFMPSKITVTYAYVTVEGDPEDYDVDEDENRREHAIVRIEDAPGQKYILDMIFKKALHLHLSYGPFPLFHEHWYAGPIGLVTYRDREIDNMLRTLGYNRSSPSKLQFKTSEEAKEAFRAKYKDAGNVEIMGDDDDGSSSWEWGVQQDAKRQRLM